MAQTGFTPISNYYSATAAAVPTAGNLIAGELAINTADGKLFYKDSAGVVQTMASKAGNVNVSSFSGGTTGLTPSTATTGAVSLAGTLGVANGGTGATTLTANNVLLGNGTSAPQFVAPSTTGNVLTSNGTTWVSSANSQYVKAWVQFAGASGTIAGSFNISSITRSSTGVYSIAFTNALADANYCATTAVSTSSAPAGCLVEMFTNGSQVATAPTTSSFSMAVLQYNAGAFLDPVYVNVAVFR